MKRGAEEVESIKKLLLEVHNGNDGNFKKYLIQENVSSLNLSKVFLNLPKDFNFSHLMTATQNTPITALDVSHNGFGPNRAENIALALQQAPNITSLNFSGNKIGPNGIKKLAAGLKKTHIKSLNLSQIYNSTAYVHDLVITLKGGPVVHLDLSYTTLNPIGVNNLVFALPGSDLISLNLAWNQITARSGCILTLTNIIPQTKLLNIQLCDCESSNELSLLHNALKLNRDNLEAAYYATLLQYLPQALKPQYLSHAFMLNENSSNEEQIEYAGGIIMNAYQEVQNRILSFLPLMSLQRAQRYQKIAGKHHQQGLQLEEETQNTTGMSPT